MPDIGKELPDLPADQVDSALIEEFVQDGNKIDERMFKEPMLKEPSRSMTDPVEINPQGRVENLQKGGIARSPGRRDSRPKEKLTKRPVSSKETQHSWLQYKRTDDDAAVQSRLQRHNSARHKPRPGLPPRAGSYDGPAASNALHAARDTILLLEEQNQTLKTNLDHALIEKEQIKLLEEQIRTLKTHLDHASVVNDQVKLLEEQNQMLKGHLDQALSANEILNKSVDKQQWVMDNREFLGRQNIDTSIQSAFTKLCGRVDAWAQGMQGAKGFFVDHIGPEMQEELQEVLPSCHSDKDLKAVLSGRKPVRMFAKGWLWYVMYRSLLPTLPTRDGVKAPIKDLWLDPGIASSVYLIEQRMFLADKQRNAISYLDLHNWRALTIELLSRLPRESREGLEDDPFKEPLRKVMKVTGPWALPTGEKEQEVALRKIFAMAVDFSQLLRKQRAYWCLAFPNSNGKTYYDSLLMEDVNANRMSHSGEEPPNQKSVEIIISPYLGKSGNSEGFHYEENICVVKARVACQADSSGNA